RPLVGAAARRDQVVVVKGDAVGAELAEAVHRLHGGEHRAGGLTEQVASLPAHRPQAEAELVLAGRRDHGPSPLSTSRAGSRRDAAPATGRPRTTSRTPPLTSPRSSPDEHR